MQCFAALCAFVSASLLLFQPKHIVFVSLSRKSRTNKFYLSSGCYWCCLLLNISISLRLDQRSRCNKFFYAFRFSFRAHNHFHVFYMLCFVHFFFVVFILLSMWLFFFYFFRCCLYRSLPFGSAGFVCGCFCCCFIRYTRILRILKYIEAKNGQIHSKTVMRINSFRK